MVVKQGENLIAIAFYLTNDSPGSIKFLFVVRINNKVRHGMKKGFKLMDERDIGEKVFRLENRYELFMSLLDCSKSLNLRLTVK
jgi:hypothetical protein